MLTEEDFTNAAKLLGVDIPAIKAVAEVESAGDGLLPDGRPKILFERHIFHRLTHGLFDGDPTISNRQPGGYGQAGIWQHKRLAVAANLDRDAALKSASWGRFQCMGFNYSLCGFSTLQDFINAMYKSEGEQLMAFVNFVKAGGLANALRSHNWKGFARGYNGKEYAKHNYHGRLADAYKKFGGVE